MPYKNGKTHPHYAHISSGTPLYLGGVYHKLNNGFITYGLISTKIVPLLKEFQDIGNEAPLIIPKNLTRLWLSKYNPTKIIKNLTQNPPVIELKVTPIHQDL